MDDGRSTDDRQTAERRPRPHLWPCRHCGMVDDYRLERAAQLELAEGLYRQDEDYEVVTFKDWLQAFQWEREPDPPIDVPTQRSSWTRDDDRAEQLRTWHHADSQTVDTLHADRTSGWWA